MSIRMKLKVFYKTKTGDNSVELPFNEFQNGKNYIKSYYYVRYTTYHILIFDLILELFFNFIFYKGNEALTSIVQHIANESGEKLGLADYLLFNSRTAKFLEADQSLATFAQPEV